MSHPPPHGRIDLGALARRVMIARGLEPDFPRDALAQVQALGGPARPTGEATRDFRALPWASIDNDDSRDLDQLTVAEVIGDDAVKVRVAIAEVDALSPRDSPVDAHARRNTTSVYTAARIFPMLPERLSTDLTSLAAAEDRLAVVVEFVVDREGGIDAGAVYRAQVRNQAKLAYDGVAAWLAGGPMPPAMAAAHGIDEQMHLQDAVAQRLRARRYEHGALDLQVLEPRAVMRDDLVVGLRQETHNRAAQLIEDFMITANGVIARFLEAKGMPTLRRIVRTPKRWDRIRDIARALGTALPSEPDAKALAAFLDARRVADPMRFPDLSLCIVKLMGRGEYEAQRAGQTPVGHFGLAVTEYLHSTAPNRRYPDLITQRLVKAALAGARSPYAESELETLAAHCSAQQDAAAKVERQVRKSAAALLLVTRIGERFDAIVTGADSKGTWVRVFDPPVEGMLVRGRDGADVGDRLPVELVRVDVERGFIDFARAGS